MSKIDWLTPETAIGARLPCGATVVKARRPEGFTTVHVMFDRYPLWRGGVVEGDAKGLWTFDIDGSHTYDFLPDLIPPAPAAKPQPAGVYVTRVMLLEAMADLRVDHRLIADKLADALGISPAKPKQAPWEAAFEVWLAEQAEYPTRKKAAAWAVTWCMGHALEVASANEVMAGVIRRRIMGDNE